MKVLIIYDSFFGNTEQVAHAIGGVFPEAEDVRVEKVDALAEQGMEGVDMLFVGSPTRAFNASEETRAFLKTLAPGALKGMRVAAFDTRIDADDINSGVGRFFVTTFGYAAKPIAKQLQKLGGKLVLEPEGFYVTDKEGPLKAGEKERAAAWARQILN
jgi:flavodoxin